MATFTIDQMLGQRMYLINNVEATQLNTEIRTRIPNSQGIQIYGTENPTRAKLVCSNNVNVALYPLIEQVITSHSPVQNHQFSPEEIQIINLLRGASPLTQPQLKQILLYIIRKFVREEEFR